MLRSPSVRVLLALVLGLAVGVWIEAQGGPVVHEAAGVLEAVGGLWLNALRMTVVPLVFALIVVGVASVADAAKAGGVVRRAIVLFTVLILAAAIYAVAASPGLLSLWPVGRAEAEAFIAASAGPQAAIAPPTFAQWLLSLVPTNPFRAAAEDAILPLTVFAVFFGFGATRLETAPREQLVGFFRAAADALTVVVQWVLLAAPIGVFALAIGVASSAGLGAAGVLAHYTAVVTLITAVATPAAILLALVWGRTPPGKLAPAYTPPLTVALATQSSIATLPAMLQAARGPLGVPERVRDLVLPLAVAVFRFTSPIANLAVVFFILHLYGLHPGALQIAAAIFVAFAVSISSVGLPGQVSFFVSVAPICAAVGAPVELLGVFLAVEVVPDIFRTTGNVAADLAATTIVSRRAKEENRREATT